MSWHLCPNKLVSEMAQMETHSHMGQGTGQDGFEMPSSPIFSPSFVILKREKGLQKEQNLFELR